ncbi:molecular chaperone DnaJ [Buchnera aphidicola (Mollitrichosiphum nigrofasciatum)]|uniref:molecular chaperone DnaJ n=1 Tax=Buchnera aphidicola TaxID=9 RepID=UPI0031B85B3E
MAKKDYYQILGLKKNAQDHEIKRAYKRLAIKFHPDRNQGNKNSENKFKEIKEAYEILSNHDKRTAYDQYGHAAFEQGSNTGNHEYDFHSSTFSSTADFGDIFGDVFGDIFGNNRNNKNTRGSDLYYKMELSLEEAVKGTTKKINIPKSQQCNVCYGSGRDKGSKAQICSTCNGKGKIHIRKGFFTVQQSCAICNGQGTVIHNPCYTCNGSGKIERTKTLSVKIPAGINTGDKIRLNHEGEKNINNELPGDLYVQIKVKKHNIFKRNENDLYCKVPINFTMAALGGNIEVPTLEGCIKIKIPAETQSGKLFRIRGKGVKSIQNNRKGDLLCKVFVETPVNLNKKQKDILLKLGDISNKHKISNNNPLSKRFFDGVKKFFDELTK